MVVPGLKSYCEAAPTLCTAGLLRAPKGAWDPSSEHRALRRDERGFQVPSLELLLNQHLVQSEKKSAQHSYHRVQKKDKDAQGRTPPTHAGRSTTDLFTASPQLTTQEKKANGKP